MKIGDDANYSDDKLPIGNDCKFTNLYEAYCSPKRLLEDIKSEQFNSNPNLSENKLKPYHHQTLYHLLYNRERIYDYEENRNDDTLNIQSMNYKRNGKLDCVFVRFNKCTNSLFKLTSNTMSESSLTQFNSTHSVDVRNLVIKIHETFGGINLNKLNYDAFGDGYEKMLADELGNGSKRYGQYFTRTVIN